MFFPDAWRASTGLRAAQRAFRTLWERLWERFRRCARNCPRSQLLSVRVANTSPELHRAVPPCAPRSDRHRRRRSDTRPGRLVGDHRRQTPRSAPGSETHADGRRPGPAGRGRFPGTGGKETASRAVLLDRPRIDRSTVTKAPEDMCTVQYFTNKPRRVTLDAIARAETTWRVP